MIYATVAAAVLVSMALVLFRAFAGPTLYDRVLAGNSFGTKTVILLGVYGFLTGRPDFLDIALLYALLNFTATIAILKFFRYRTLTTSMDDLDEPTFNEPLEALGESADPAIASAAAAAAAEKEPR